VGLWKHIKKGREILSSFTRIEVGNGIRISFWHDVWYGDMVLKVAFPTLFGLAHVKDAYVANNLEFLGGSNQWNMNFSIEVHD
jgi:hypothetical protein